MCARPSSHCWEGFRPRFCITKIWCCFQAPRDPRGGLHPLEYQRTWNELFQLRSTGMRAHRGHGSKVVERRLLSCRLEKQTRAADGFNEEGRYPPQASSMPCNLSMGCHFKPVGECRRDPYGLGCTVGGVWITWIAERTRGNFAGQTGGELGNRMNL